MHPWALFYLMSGIALWTGLRNHPVPFRAWASSLLLLPFLLHCQSNWESTMFGLLRIA
jgi:hypothetical protein